MDFGQSIATCFRKYADFSGRASRSEYWWFALFQVLVTAAASLMGDLTSGLVSLALLLPALAVGARRLHDIGKSGWWLLIWLIPLIGWIVLIVWAASKGDANDNSHGAVPAV